jgi:thioredoxin-like negative regulator of GroEL
MSGSSQNQQLLSKATALYHSGDYREAIQVWQEVLQRDPENQRAQEGIRMASLLLEEAETSDASTPASEQSETPSPRRSSPKSGMEFSGSAIVSRPRSIWTPWRCASPS